MTTLRKIWLLELASARGWCAALAGMSLIALPAIAAEPATAMDAQMESPGPAPGPGGDPDRGDRHHGHRRGPPPIERVLEEHAERLGLDADTRAKIRAIADTARETNDAHRARLHELHQEMRKILRSDRPDVDAVMRQADAIGAAETEEHKHRLRTMLEIRTLLTPAQRETLVEIHQERRKLRKDRHRPPAD